MKLLLLGLVSLSMNTHVNKSDAFDVRLCHTDCNIRPYTEIIADFPSKFVNLSYASHASLPDLDFLVG